MRTSQIYQTTILEHESNVSGQFVVVPNSAIKNRSILESSETLFDFLGFIPIAVINSENFSHSFALLLEFQHRYGPEHILEFKTHLKNKSMPIRELSLEAGKELHILEGHKARVCAVAVTPDGKRIVSGLWDKTIRVWDLEAGKEIHTLEGHEAPVCAVAVTPDGRRIVSGSYDETIRVWDLEAGEEIHILEGHKDYVHAVAVTPDGRRIVSGSYDKTIRVWDLEAGKEIHTLEGHEASVHAVAVTPDGRRIVSGSWDKTIKVWDIVNEISLYRDFSEYRAFSEYIFSSKVIPVEHSPLSAESIADIIKTASGPGMGAYAGYLVTGNSWYFLIAAPIGMIIIMAAKGIGEGIEKALREKIYKLITGKEYRHE